MHLPATHPKRLGKMEGKDLGDEYMIYDVEGDAVHILNGTARELYLLCDGHHSVDDLAQSLVDRYGVDEPTARSDVDKIIERLVDLGVISLP